jgi:hypothetical protein
MLTSIFYHSRQSIKKYVLANNKLAPASQNAFDSQFNKAIKAGVEKGDFIQPKGKPYPLSRTPQPSLFINNLYPSYPKQAPFTPAYARLICYRT